MPLAAPPVAEALEEAFGRPSPQAPSLDRAPEPPPEPAVAERPNPWRDPGAPVDVGEPALPEPAQESPEPPVAERLTLRQAMFDRRLRPSAIVGLLVLCLPVGAGGAALGGLLVSRVPAVTADPEFRLSTVEPSVDRPAGSVAKLAAQVLPAVVSIEVRAGDGGDSGSGFVIDAKGYILTNNHVVSLAATNSSARMSVVLSDGTRVQATLVGRDPQTDLAVIKVNVTNLVVAQLGDSDKLQVGDPVVAIGSPLGLAGTVTTGIVSAKNRPVRLASSDSDTNAVIDAVQTDAAVNPGNSGGPLIDGTGAVIGINTAIRTLGGSETSGSIGLGFAIPINYARTIAQELMSTGKAIHASMGVNTRSVTDGSVDGAQVQNVTAGGPAERAGIREGDVITTVGDRPVRDAEDLVVVVMTHRPGETVKVTVSRSGRSMTVDVTLVQS